MEFCVFFTALLTVRLIFYSSPYRKHIAFYGLKAAAESGIFVALFISSFEIELACVGLFIALNLLTFIIETRLPHTHAATDRRRADRRCADRRCADRPLSLHYFPGLVLYIACFGLVVLSGKISSFEAHVIELAENAPILQRIELYIIIIGSLLILSEEEHIIQFFRRFAMSEEDRDQQRNRIAQQRIIGFAERLLIYILIMFSQYIAAGIIAGSKLIVSAGASKQQRIGMLTASIASVCLAVATAMVINLLRSRI
ncbi:MAG: hypothetical protein CMN78_04355 [Spirochaetales bacterium]|nr:hypothetical protein [Spirochaetales bacterium]MAG13809.1 hypothetical protein [Spirochaetales bacterium]